LYDYIKIQHSVENMKGNNVQKTT